MEVELWWLGEAEASLVCLPVLKILSRLGSVGSGGASDGLFQCEDALIAPSAFLHFVVCCFSCAVIVAISEEAVFHAFFRVVVVFWDALFVCLNVWGRFVLVLLC